MKLLLLYVMSFAGFFAVAEAECQKPEEHPYQLHFTPEQKSARTEDKLDLKYRSNADFTMCVHFKLNNDEFLEIEIPIGSKTSYAWMVDPSVQGVDINGGSLQVTKGKMLAGKEWYYTCVVLKNKKGTLYVNGEKQDARDMMSDMDESDQDFETLEMYLVGDKPQEGTSHYVAEVRYYDRDLSAEEVKAVSCGHKDAPKDLINWDELSWCDTKPEKYQGGKSEHCS